MCPARGRGEARGSSYLSSISSHRPCLPTRTPSHALTPSLTPRVLPALGRVTFINISAVWLCPFQRRGQGRGLLPVERSLWPHSFLCPPPTPHPFIVNSHFCTGFEPGDVGSHFFFSLCWHLRALEAWPTSRLHLGESQGVSSPAPSAKDFKISVLLLEGCGAQIPWQGGGRGVERCSLTGMSQLSPSTKWARPPGSLRSLSEIIVELESLFPLSLFGTDRVGEYG